MMLREPVTIPVSEQDQLRELNRLLQLGAPALIAADGKERIELPETVHHILKRYRPGDAARPGHHADS